MSDSLSESNNYLPFMTVNNILQKYGCKNYYIIILYFLSSTTWALTSIILFIPTFIMKKIPCEENNKYWCNSHLNNTISMEETFNLTDNECEYFNQSYFIGNIVGSTIQSYLADIIGRKIVALPCFFLTSLLGFLMTCFSKYVYIVILRFCQGFLLSSANGIIFVLATENAPLESHPIISLTCNLSFSFGLILLVPISCFSPNWRTTFLIGHVPSFILPIILWFLLPESLHFLFEKKEEDKIDGWIKYVNKYSRQNLKINVDSCIEKFHGVDGEFAKGGYTNKGFIKVFQYYNLNKKYIIYLLMVIFIWFNEFLSYYVFTQNAVALTGNPYLNFIYIALVEIPTSLLGPITIDKFGRKIPLSVSFFIIGFLEIVLVTLPVHMKTFYLILFLIIKAFIALNCIYMFVYFSEIFPTEIRNSSVGVLTNIGSIGGIVAGVIINTWIENKMIYLIIFSILSFLNIGFIYFLPNIDN